MLLVSKTCEVPAVYSVDCARPPHAARDAQSLLCSRLTLAHTTASERELAAVHNDGDLVGRTTLRAICLERSQRLEARGELAKDDVPAVEMWAWDGRHKELGAVAVRPRIGHRQEARAGVGDRKALIGKLAAVDALAASACARGEIAALAHEAL